MKRTAAFLIFIIFILALLFLFLTHRTPKNNLINQDTVQNTQKMLPAKILEVGERPQNLKVTEGFKIGIFSKDLPNARDLQFTPDGTLLVSLTASGKVIALPDKDDNGVSDENITVLSGLRRPHGMAFYKGKLFVAEERQVNRYSYDETSYRAVFEKKLFDLPLGGRHFTRSLVFDKEGNLYVSVGSTCDTCVESDPFLATVIVSDADGRTPRVYSKGLRNAVFLAVDESSGNVWAAEMGRDFLGDETPSDEIDILDDGADFGWPYCYGDKNWDKGFGQKNQSYCNTTVKPFYKIPAHSSPLGLTFINSPQFPKDWQKDLLVSYHGSWNRSVPVGYKVVRISLSEKPEESDFITGFTRSSARPVDVAFDREGSLFVSDDTAGKVYKIVKN